MNYRVVRTDTADALIRKIILHVAEQFDEGTALEKLDELEKSIMLLSDNPYMGEIPRYSIVFLLRIQLPTTALGSSVFF